MAPPVTATVAPEVGNAIGGAFDYLYIGVIVGVIIGTIIIAWKFFSGGKKKYKYVAYVIRSGNLEIVPLNKRNDRMYVSATSGLTLLVPPTVQPLKTSDGTNAFFAVGVSPYMVAVDANTLLKLGITELALSLNKEGEHNVIDLTKLSNITYKDAIDLTVKIARNRLDLKGELIIDPEMKLALAVSFDNFFMSVVGTVGTISTNSLVSADQLVTKEVKVLKQQGGDMKWILYLMLGIAIIFIILSMFGGK